MNFNKSLPEHRKWFDSKGNEGARADFRGMYLENLDLRKTCLVEANLQGIRLIDSDLREADLRGVNLQDSILTRCNFQDANLEEADLMWAIFKDVNLTNIFFNGVYLQGADLSCVNGLTWDQLLFALWDEDTQFPVDLDRTLI